MTSGERDPSVREGAIVHDEGARQPERPRLRVPPELRRPVVDPRDVPVSREAIVLPLLFLTVAALGGVRVAAQGGLVFVPPTLVSLVLATLLLGVLVRSGALAPERLVHERRGALANLSGTVVLLAWFAASAQVFTALTPEAGLFAFVFTAFFVLLLWNTMAAGPDRRQALRSLAVVLGGAFVLKFVLLAAVYEPDGGLLHRLMIGLLEGVSLGALGFVPDGPATGYVVFFTLALYAVGLILLPARRRPGVRS